MLGAEDQSYRIPAGLPSSLDANSDAAAADTQRCLTSAGSTPSHLVKQRHDDPAARAGQRVAGCDRPPLG